MSELAEFEWKQQLCPLETVKVFKSGYSIHCPEEKQVAWVSKDYKNSSILKHLQSKHGYGFCKKCQAAMKKFIQGQEITT